jgi:hypothetical protein
MHTTPLKALNGHDDGSYVENLENKVEKLERLERLLRRVRLHLSGSRVSLTSPC